MFSILLCTWFLGPASAQSTKLFLPETNTAITLSFIHDHYIHDQYSSIIIRSSGKAITLTSKDPFLRIPATRKERKEAFIWNADTPGVKIDPSRFFLIGQYTVDNLPHTLLFFLSGPRASDASPILIIGFSEAGKPYKIFEHQYEMTSFEQTEQGTLLTGKATMSQDICGFHDRHEPLFMTYNPYSVYLIRPYSKAAYELDSSRAYNQKHYTWAGPKVSERITVVENLPGHPKFFTASRPQADKLMAKIKCLP